MPKSRIILSFRVRMWQECVCVCVRETERDKPLGAGVVVALWQGISFDAGARSGAAAALQK